jgi:hypothetical protein
VDEVGTDGLDEGIVVQQLVEAREHRLERECQGRHEGEQIDGCGAVA